MFGSGCQPLRLVGLYAVGFSVDFLIGKDGPFRVMVVCDFHVVRLAVMNAAVNRDDGLLAAVKDNGLLVAGFRRQTPQTGNAVVAMVMDLNIAGLHLEAIGVLPGIFGKIHGIAMQRKYGV